MFPRFTLAVAVSLACFQITAAETNSPASARESATGLLNGLLGFAQGLEINPKLITPLDGEGTSIGVEYKYENGLKRYALRGDRDIALSLLSQGLVAVDPDRVPNDVFTHSVRLSVIDLWPRQPAVDSAAARHNALLKERINTLYFDPWTRELERSQPDPNKLNEYVDGAARELADYGRLEADAATQNWFLHDASEKRTNWDNALKRMKERTLFLAFDLSADLEHDQALTNLQFAGSALLRGKLLVPYLDFPFELLRGGPPKNWLNRDRGPHFWAGISVVNASENEARQALTSEHETFPRLHLGAQYRTELFSISDTKSVALELNWRFYYEFDAPEPVEDAELDRTSYFKATVLFPGNLFLEYTDGKLPADVEGGSTVTAGWRYNF